jgi:hypothetical protein
LRRKLLALVPEHCSETAVNAAVEPTEVLKARKAGIKKLKALGGPLREVIEEHEQEARRRVQVRPI